VWIDGKDTKEQSLLLEIRQKVGMVFQNPDNQLVSSIVEEDVGFGPENLGVPTKEIGERVEEALHNVDMEDYRLHTPSHLSGGQKQRVAIAGVLAMKPECIVLDEATAMLDPAGRKEILQTVHKLNKEEGITVILITHYMEETLDADKVFVMHAGKIVMEGMPEQIFSREEELKNYGVLVPQIIELTNQLRQEGIHLPATILSMEDMVEAICQYV
jgi:energy-coupling factor transport system ATP-binding protein